MSCLRKNCPCKDDYEQHLQVEIDVLKKKLEKAKEALDKAYSIFGRIGRCAIWTDRGTLHLIGNGTEGEIEKWNKACDLFHAAKEALSELGEERKNV